MANRNIPVQKRFVFTRSSKWMKVVIAAAVVCATAALLVLHAVRQNNRMQAAALKEQAYRLEQEQLELTERINRLGSAESAKEIARDVLGLVDPDTVVYQPED